MSKPDDIPQDVWSAALDAAGPPHSFQDVIERIARALMAERKRCTDEVDTLIEILEEGLMTDADLTFQDRAAMLHQIEALEVAATYIRKGD